MGLPTYKNFNYMSPAIMWLISLDYNFNKHIILMGGVFFYFPKIFINNYVDTPLETC